MTKPPAKRRRLDAPGAREAILASAEALLIEGGPGGLRLTEVATRAGVSHPNVLYHFGSVAELQTQLAQRIAERLAGEVTCIFSSDGSLPGSVDEVIAAVFDVFDKRGFARLLAWLCLSPNGPGFAALGTRLRALCDILAAHPELRGEEHIERRKRLIPAIELAICAAIGYGLVGAQLDAFWAPQTDVISVSELLSGLFAGYGRAS